MCVCAWCGFLLLLRIGRIEWGVGRRGGSGGEYYSLHAYADMRSLGELVPVCVRAFDARPAHLRVALMKRGVEMGGVCVNVYF